MFSLSSVFVGLLCVATASAQTITGAFTCEAAGEYTLCQNLWGACTYISLLYRVTYPLMTVTMASCRRWWSKLDVDQHLWQRGIMDDQLDVGQRP